MKVCHITSVHQSTDPRIFQKECISLAEAGYEVTLIAPGTKDRIEKGVRVIAAGAMPASRRERMIRYSRHVVDVALAQKAELYHLHDPELLAHVDRIHKTGAKIIFDAHEDVAEDIEEKPWIPAPLRMPASKVYTNYFKRKVKKLSGLIGVTPHQYQKLETLCPNTAMITNYPILPAIQEKFVRGTGEEIVLCFTGNMSSLWNLPTVAAAVEQMEGVTFRICGPEAEPTLSQLKAMSSYGTRIHYLGRLPITQAREEQRAADVGIAVSSYCRNSGWKIGTLGNTKLFEYMAMGLPVICTDFDLWRDIVDRYRCGICVDPTNQKAVAEAIRYLQRNSEERLEMGRNGQRAVWEEFHWGTQVPILLDLYRRVLADFEKVGE